MSCGSDTITENNDSTPSESTSQLPDKTGMTLKGKVTCNNSGVKGVVVSDGFELTTTDEDGVYYLASEKKNGYVFISLPSGYEVAYGRANEPEFYKYTTKDATESEQLDFSLTKVDNTNYKLMVMTDFHLANRNDDLSQYADFVKDVNASISSESADGTKVYGLTLGDLTWDLYWYRNDFGLSDFMDEIEKVKCPVFNTMGNHDNDPYVADDWNAEKPYKQKVCPSYYSFNLGNIHYVVLDNIKYLNDGASIGTEGDRNYEGVIVADQMEWLKKDLATVTDKKTPLVVAMHINLYKTPGMSNGEQTNVIGLSNGEELEALLADFETVHILTGHTHVHFTVEEDNIMEHNLGAVCATWWWTGKQGYAGNYTCKDGTPGGYAVWDVKGDDMQWYYKGTGKERDYQFRAYDLNETYITAARYAPNSTDEKLAPYVGPYGTKRSDNKVLINVWGYDEKWKIEVTENGTQLPVTRVSGMDPLHIISYEAIRLNKTGQVTSSFLTGKTAHLFEVTASSATSTLEIKVTDRFGEVYQQTMERPKELSCDME